jgi:hypothetical protein
VGLFPFSSLSVLPLDSYARILDDAESGHPRELLWPTEGGAIFVTACFSRILESKNGNIPVVGRNAAANGNGKPISAGDCDIRIIFGACTHSKRKLTEPAPSTKSATVNNITIMFVATPLMSKNPKHATEKVTQKG